MFKRNTTFKCTQCGAKFTTPDFEYMATVYTMPQRCPNCGSIRTRPTNLLFGKLTEITIYRAIWNYPSE